MVENCFEGHTEIYLCYNIINPNVCVCNKVS